jgi:hypothetical protein
VAAVGGDGVRVEVPGLAEWKAALRAVPGRWVGGLARANRSVADPVAARARQLAGQAGSTEAAAQSSITATATQSAAKIAWGGSRVPFSAGAYMGAKRYPQFKPWVGNSWEVGGAGGPRDINDAVREMRERIAETYAEVFMTAARAAFPTEF